MIQLAFGLGVDTSNVWWLNNALRTLFSTFDIIVYQLIVLVYQILFTIADSSILSSQFIKDFYGRVQLIIGVFMIFKLAVSVLQAVINPDVLTDKKRGMGQIITRIITMLAMFTAITPLNIPDADPNSYNAYLNQHGLLFGTLYSLQARILDGGAIEKLILGDEANISSNDQDTGDVDSNSGINKKESANRMASYILKTFVRINLKEDATNEGDNNVDNYRCPQGDIDGGEGDVYIVYKKTDASPMEILEYINTSCYEGPDMTIGEGDGKYALAYFPVVSTICGGLVLFVLLGFCIDVAIRALKLAILRLIAPIPIISYIDPQSAEKGAFANWVKLLTSTFLNLFIILAVVFFAINIVGKICDSDQSVLQLPLNDGLSIVNAIATVFIIIGIFFFAKQAPKFIMDALGIKGMGLGVGLSGVLGAAGGIMGGGGLMGAAAGFMGAANDASNAAAQGKQAPPALGTQRANFAKMITGNDKNDGSMGYRMQKALSDRAGARAFNRLYGVNEDSLNAKKKQMYDLQDDAERAKNLYERYSRGEASEAELRAYATDNHLTYDTAQQAFTDAAGNVTGARQYLENSYLQAQSTAGKAKADFEKMQKIGGRANVLMTPEQEHLASRAERRQFDRDNSLIVGGYRAARDGWNEAHATGHLDDGLDAARETFANTLDNRRANRPAEQSRADRRSGSNRF